MVVSTSWGRWSLPGVLLWLNYLGCEGHGQRLRGKGDPALWQWGTCRQPGVQMASLSSWLRRGPKGSALLGRLPYTCQLLLMQPASCLDGAACVQKRDLVQPRTASGCLSRPLLRPQPREKFVIYRPPRWFSPCPKGPGQPSCRGWSCHALGS